MNPRILHLVDASTPLDALDMLAPLLAADGDSPPRAQQLLFMGHRSTGLLARQASLPMRCAQWLPSMGWADPTGWRAVRRAIASFQPTHVHAWGIAAIAAVAVSNFRGIRIATWTQQPPRHYLRLLRIIDRRGQRERSPWRWVASSSSVARSFSRHGLPPERVTRIRPGIGMASVQLPDSTGGPLALKRQLGIRPDDGPVILLGGEGPHARHDFGLWAVAILQQIFPRVRAIVRQDPRDRSDLGLDRFRDALPSDHTLLLAPPGLHWKTLINAADIFLITPDGPIPTNSILYAMAAGVPVIGTPVECVSELVEHAHNGLLATAITPRTIASRLEEFMSDSTIRWPLTDRARADLYTNFSVSTMVKAYRELEESAEEVVIGK